MSPNYFLITVHSSLFNWLHPYYASQGYISSWLYATMAFRLCLSARHKSSALHEKTSFLISTTCHWVSGFFWTRSQVEFSICKNSLKWNFLRLCLRNDNSYRIKWELTFSYESCSCHWRDDYKPRSRQFGAQREATETPKRIDPFRHECPHKFLAWIESFLTGLADSERQQVMSDLPQEDAVVWHCQFEEIDVTCLAYSLRFLEWFDSDE